MLALLLFCIVGSVFAQQSSTQGTTSQIESEDANANTQTISNPIDQSYNVLQPAAQQRRPYYTAPVPRQPENYNYMPYSFNYVSQGEDGSSSRQETGDSSGRVVGSYTLAVEDGRRRVVDYIADQNGFRATVDTNEPGTDVQSPADVVFHSAGLGRNAAPQTPYRPANVYRPRPTYYNNPNVINAGYHREDMYAPYRQYDTHAYDRYRHNDDYRNHAYDGYRNHANNGYRHNAYASYYDNSYRYSW